MRHVIALAAVLTLVTAAPAGASHSSPGAAGLGDRLFPGLGNGGYDALHYDLDLRYATAAPAQGLDGTVTIYARATQGLSRFNLDFAGQSVGAVYVDGRAARWAREGEELVITPKRAVKRHEKFRVTVAHFTAAPTDPAVSSAFFVTPHGSATAPQPDLAHDFLPSNDHPRDKASFRIRFDVPAGVVAVANGVPTGRRTHHGRTKWSYLQRQPMATGLIQLAVGTYDLDFPGRHRGVPLRDVTAPTLTASLQPALARTGAHLDYMLGAVGRYPFDIYGSLILDVDLGFALETQTLSLFDKVWFEAGQGLWDPVMLHELSHMWFGDSVTPYEWSDLWLNEGHASWYEFLYAEENGFLVEDTEDYPDPQGYATVDALMKRVYELGDQWRAENGPVARPASAETLFSLNVYHGGALVLYALREKIGRRAFERLEREWVTRYRDRSVSTQDFIALASRVAHRDLRGFLGRWLFDTTTPPMPNHPDWTVAPVEEPVPAAQAFAAGGRRHR